MVGRWARGGTYEVRGVRGEGHIAGESSGRTQERERRWEDGPEIESPWEKTVVCGERSN